MYNCRGQRQDLVDKSVDIGEYKENVFKSFLQKQNINLIKQSKFKHYDFTLQDYKNIKIEFKTSTHTKERFDQVFIGLDKILYFLRKQTENKDNIYILIFGFFENKENISYYYDVIDINKYLTEYKRRLLKCKVHIEIPTITFKPISYLIKTFNSITDSNNNIKYNTNNIKILLSESV